MGNFLEEFKKIETPSDMIKRILRAEIANRLSGFSESENQKFRLIFPTGLEKETEEKLRSALDLCNRTLAKHRAEA